jgi:hypothetical protein
MGSFHAMKVLKKSEVIRLKQVYVLISNIRVKGRACYKREEYPDRGIASLHRQSPKLVCVENFFNT